MATSVIQLVRWLGRAWPNSPILDKEMRVTSRRGWLYGLRLAYIAVLGLFAAAIWGAATQGLTRGAAGFRGADTGKSIVSSVLWFQFFAVQGITIVFMSASISGEIRRRTLPLLLTTPLDCFQIVREKALGGLFYALVLLLCCLPLLSILRVFGGVPVGYIFSSLAVTATACFFASAVSAYFSALTGNSLIASLLAAGAVAAYNLAGYASFPAAGIALDLFLCAGVFASLEHGDGRGKSEAASVLRVIAVASLIPCAALGGVASLYPSSFFPPLSPVYAMVRNTRDLMVPGKSSALTVGLAVHCAAMVLVSFGVLRSCSTRLYRLARARIWGVPAEVREHSPMIDPVATRFALANLDIPPVAPEALAEINRLAGHPVDVVLAPVLWLERRAEKAEQTPGTWRFHRERLGSPLLWKDTRRILPRNHQLTLWLFLLPLCLMFAVSWVSVALGACRHVAWHAGMLSVYVGGGTLLTAIFSAITLSAERQSRTWPILMTTDLTDGHILWAKSASVFYRALPAWLPLLAHVTLCTIVPLLHPLVLAGAVLVAAGVHMLLCGSGFYFSMVLRGTSRPLIANLALAGVLWIFVPILAPLVGGFAGGRQAPAGGGPWANLGALTPVGQMVALVDASPGLWSLDAPEMPSGTHLLFPLQGRAVSPLLESFCNVLLALAMYGSLGAFLLWRARRRFRRNAFA